MTAVLDKKADLAAHLNKAADVIEERGHCHEAFEARTGQVCIVGALGVALADNATHLAFVRARESARSLIEALNAEIDAERSSFRPHLGWAPISRWNDERPNSGHGFKHNKREAVRLLRRVARKVAGQ